MENNASYEKEIANNRFLFEHELQQAQKLVKQGNTAEALTLITYIANFAWNNYCGFHSSEALEGLLAKISAGALPKNTASAESKGHPVKKVLHVASHIYETGGHTPLMLKWIQRDPEHEHKLFLTLQHSAALPLKQLQKHGFVTKNIIFTRDTNESPLATASLLHELSAGYDMVVLHIHPDDIIPNLAFANSKPAPVYILNHADHSFWLGAAVADGLIQIRETNIAIDAQRRGIPADGQFYLPIPVEAIDETATNNTNDAKRLGIDDYQTILLSTSSENKFVFFNDYNYFEAIIPVLNKNPQAVLLVIGVRPEAPMAKKYAHPQIKFLGIIMPTELAAIEAVADIYVENLPYSSFTALLQVFMRKKAIHFVYNPLAITQLFNDNSAYTKNKAEWQETLDRLINDVPYREIRTKELYERNYYDYTPAAWKERLNAIYKSVEGLTLTYNKLADKPVDAISDNEALLFKLLKERYRYNFFRRNAKVFIGRLANFILLKAKGYKMKKLY